MAQKQLKGVSGVLGLLTTPSTQTEEVVDLPQASDDGEKDKPNLQAMPTESVRPTQKQNQEARRGRPPGRAAQEPVVREKVSLRLRADLAQAYRDWSWEERCQFSDLVDRAMEQYLKHRGKARKPETP